jgi:hypothetical protein
MTVPISTVPAVRQYLVNAITAQVQAANLTEPGVEVYLSLVDHETPEDVIVVAGVRREVKPGALVGGGGKHWKFEDYHVEVIIDCFAGGTDFPAVDARAYQLLSIVETAVRLDPSMGGLVLVSHPATSDSQHTWDDAHKGARAQITMQIYVCTEQ